MAGYCCFGSMYVCTDVYPYMLTQFHTHIYIYNYIYRYIYISTNIGTCFRVYLVYIYIYIVTHSNFKKMTKRVSRMVSIAVLHVQYTPVWRKAFPKLAMRADAAAHPFPLAGRLGGGPVGCVGTILLHMVTPGN